MLHLAFGILRGRLGHRLQGFPIIFGRESDELGFRVVASGLNSLIVLDHDTIDVIVNSLAQEVIRIYVVEGRNNDLVDKTERKIKTQIYHDIHLYALTQVVSVGCLR